MNSRFRAIVASILLVALFTPPAVYSSGDKKRTVRTTAYTHSESDHLKYGRKTAIGTQLKRSTSYTSAAADWSRFPVGTTFRMKGSKTNYVIDDYGSALVGTDTVDIYHTSKSAMNHWGVRHVDIEITKWGDYEKSRQILSQRTKYKHCRQMYAAIPKNSNESKRGWFWNRKPKDNAPAPDPAPTPRPKPRRAPAPTPATDIMLAQNDRKSFGIRSWFNRKDNSQPEPVTSPQPAPQPRQAPTRPSEPKIQSPQPQPAELMLAANDTSRSKSRWQWLRKLVGRDDTAPTPTTAPAIVPSVPQPVSPSRPIESQPEPAIMLASNTPQPAAVATPQAAIASTPAPAPVQKPTPVPAPAVIEIASIEIAPPSAAAPKVRAVEPIAISRTSTPSAMKVSHSSSSEPRRVVFAVARPDSSVPHRKREVRSLPAGWQP
jgi:3D (Asp-Asp-Asp) domain-containing protein